ncbi:cytochrome P450 4C1-like [Culex pipiens pallens]|uniref:cytochrome P450 4C1-like n=1 Tax=Culex pipiens pallens TaxID=42434 RepID=UPI001952E68F|nr:cytochrome P450 4C1-like [Culex pipiens pallens]
MFVLLVVLAVLLLLLFLDYANKVRFSWITNNLPTVPKCYPLIGNVLMFTGKSKVDRFELFNRAFRAKNRLQLAWAGPSPFVMVLHPDLISKVLCDPNCCDRPVFYRFLKLKLGIFSAEYDFWKPARKMLNPTFNVKTLNDFVPLFEKCAQMMVDRLKSCPKGVALDIAEYTRRCALEMVLATTLGASVLVRDENEKFLECLRILFVIVGKRMFNGLLFSDLIYSFTQDYADEERARKFVTEFSLKIIKERQEVLKGTSPEVESEEGIRTSRIFIDQLLTMADSDGQLSDENICEQILTIIIAGSDTSGFTVAYTCLFLAMFPHHQDRLMEEIDTFHPPGGPAITPDTLKDLPFMDQFLKESMRIAPMGPLVGRQNTADIELDGHRIPKGTSLSLNFFELHRRQDIWGPNAHQFDPENFAPERTEGRHPFAFVPFSSGYRNCIGWKYAMINTKVMLIHILRNFRLKTELRFEELRFASSVTLDMLHKHMVVLEPRSRV